MTTRYSIYKGLQKPLIYKGFKGKFIGWGIGSLVIGLLTGGFIGAISNMYLGSFLTIAIIAGGLVFTFQYQKKGLYSKTRHRGIFIHRNSLKIRYAENKKNSVQSSVCGS